jgi:hypothetical protein
MTGRIIEFQNIYLVAALMAYKFHYYGVNRKDQSHQKFQFTDALTASVYWVNPSSGNPERLVNASIGDLEQLFLSETLLFPPGYSDALRRVKYILHSRDDSDASDERFGTSSNPVLPNRKPFSAIG